jgi:hypothetical protein
MVNFINSNPSCDPDGLTVFQDAFDINLPNEYAEFLKQYNGCEPDGWHSFTSKYGKITSNLESFFGLTCVNSYDRLTKRFIESEDRIPRELLAIGHDSGGGLVCIAVKGKDRGKVFFWDREFEEEAPAWNNTRLLANSFNEFLRSLTLDTI